jgi:hypothetical protein
MKQLFAIAQLTLRAALRERVAWSMLVLVAGTLLLLPLGLRGDGTLAGELRMHVRYSTGLSTVLLAAMTLWVSCAAVAGDLSSKRLQMVLTKPVSRATLWWGKWLAVAALSISLLMVCGGVTYWRVSRRVAHADVNPDERAQIAATMLTARRPERPRIEDLTENARALYAEQVRTGRIHPDAPEEEVMRELLNLALIFRNAAQQGETVRWEIPLSRPLDARDLLQLSFTFDGASMGAARVPGEWRIGLADGREAVFTAEIHQNPRGETVLHVPITEEMIGAARVWVEFENKAEDAQMVFFSTRDGVLLYRAEGGFGPNLFRSLVLLAGLLALLAALGISTGSLFSLPVACYATAMILVLQAFSGTLERVLEDGTTLNAFREHSEAMVRFDRFMMTAYQGMHAMIRPLDVDRPLDRVSRGVLVSGREVSRTVGLRMIPGLVVISLIGIGLFQRREAGVAE